MMESAAVRMGARCRRRQHRIGGRGVCTLGGVGRDHQAPADSRRHTAHCLSVSCSKSAFRSFIYQDRLALPRRNGYLTLCAHLGAFADAFITSVHAPRWPRWLSSSEQATERDYRYTTNNSGANRTSEHASANHHALVAAPSSLA